MGKDPAWFTKAIEQARAEGVKAERENLLSIALPALAIASSRLEIEAKAWEGDEFFDMAEETRFVRKEIDSASKKLLEADNAAKGEGG